jgi:hypothetical protein
VSALAKQLETASAIEQLWAALLPNVEKPAKSQFIRWAAMAPESTLVRSINRTFRKYERGDLRPEDAGRYTTGTVKCELRRVAEEGEVDGNR